MTFAEIVLRLGVTFVSWILIYMHLLAIWVVRIAQCPGGDTGPWKMSFLTGLLAFGAAIAVPYGHRLPGMARTFRYFALPLLPLLPWAVWTVWPYLAGTTLGGLSFCDVRLGSEGQALQSAWEQRWAPLQLIALAAIATGGWRVWRLPAAVAGRE